MSAPRTPSYRLHKPTGQAVVTLNGKDHYLGKFQSIASREEYDRIISQWLAGGRRLPSRGSDLTINELMEDYVPHVEAYYVKGGKQTSEVSLIKESLRVLKRLYGDTPARDFGPLALKSCRQAFIDQGLCRNECNRRTRLIVRFFKWAVGNELVPPSVHHGLQAVDGLRKGRTDVRESPPVKPVADVLVDATLPHLAPQVAAMIELQRLSGMRPGETVIMRSCDLDTSGETWIYRPSSHKVEHHDKERVVYLGPKAQAVVRPWLRPNLEEFLFQPSEAEAGRIAEMRKRRKSKVQPSQQDRSRPGHERQFNDCYSVRAYHHAITRGCARAFPHPELSKIPRKRLTPEQRAELAAWNRKHRWAPNRLRHLAATRLRREFGLDTARVILGHTSPAVTLIYAEADQLKASEAMLKLG